MILERAGFALETQQARTAALGQRFLRNEFLGKMEAEVGDPHRFRLEQERRERAASSPQPAYFGFSWRLPFWFFILTVASLLPAFTSALVFSPLMMALLFSPLIIALVFSPLIAAAFFSPLMVAAVFSPLISWSDFT